MKMKTPKIIWAALMAATLLPVAALATTQHEDKAAMQSITQEMNATAGLIKNYSVTQRDQAVKQIKATLDKLDAQIARIETKLGEHAEQMDQAAHEKSSAALTTIKENRKQVAQWYSSMQNSTAATWQNVKSNFLKSYVSLQQAFDKAQNEL